ncbi:MAG: prolyl oligopeptidase family serine peptidase, partial [Myxococcota bacterium]
RWADQLDRTAPILMLHGTEDWRVAPHDALAMAQALLDTDHPFRLMLLEGEGHSLAGHRDEVHAAARAWVDRYVRDQRPPPEPAPRDQPAGP